MIPIRAHLIERSIRERVATVGSAFYAKHTKAVDEIHSIGFSVVRSYTSDARDNAQWSSRAELIRVRAQSWVPQILSRDQIRRTTRSAKREVESSLGAAVFEWALSLAADENERKTFGDRPTHAESSAKNVSNAVDAVYLREPKQRSPKLLKASIEASGRKVNEQFGNLVNEYRNAAAVAKGASRSFTENRQVVETLGLIARSGTRSARIVSALLGAGFGLAVIVFITRVYVGEIYINPADEWKLRFVGVINTIVAGANTFWGLWKGTGKIPLDGPEPSLDEIWQSTASGLPASNLIQRAPYRPIFGPWVLKPVKRKPAPSERRYVFDTDQVVTRAPDKTCRRERPLETPIRKRRA